MLYNHPQLQTRRFCSNRIDPSCDPTECELDRGDYLKNCGISGEF